MSLALNNTENHAMGNLKPVYEVSVIWDPDANVWVALSDDIPGLSTEAESFQELVDKVLNLAPTLLEMNCNLTDIPNIPLAFQQRHYVSLGAGG